MKTPIIPAAVLALLFATAALAAEPVAPAQVAQQIQDKKAAPFVLDVRTPGEFAGGHVPGAYNIPVQMLDQRLSEVPKDRDVVVYCESGTRASKAESLLGERGYTRVRQMSGSMAAWREAKLPMER